MSTTEQIALFKQQKILKRREQKLASYYKNKTNKVKQYKTTNEAVRKREYRINKEEKTEKERIWKRKYREALRSKIIASNPIDNTDQPTCTLNDTFNNRTSKHRSIQKLKAALPNTPKRRSATIAAYLQNSKSPTVEVLRNLEIIPSPEERSDRSAEKAAIQDIKTAIDKCKSKRSNDATTSMNVLVASISGENVSKNRCRKRVARKLGLPVRRISQGGIIRTNILKSDKSCWTYINRKTRSDALSEETKRLAYDFWMKPGISRPTGNKKDIKRERIGPNNYVSHMVHILEKTQTEVYLDFIREHPSIKISQRSFENCKPFFIRQVRPQDRQTCCCRYHIEIKSAFKSCMQYRKNIDHTDRAVPVYDSISDIVDTTLCPKETEDHKLSCLKRTCNECGINKLELLKEEMDTSDTAPLVKWERFEKVDMKVKGNKVIKKLTLVRKETKVGELFEHFVELLKSFPLHQHRASWQSKHFQSLVANLPKNHCVLVHDFSENYRCTDLNEIQSAYFQKTEVSVHVSVIHRHALIEYDGVESSEEYPEIITEHFYVISDDQQHDQHFVHEVRQNISDYLKSISYNVETMHEYTDGCACQYKSRHCFGDISNSCKDFGYKTFTRNFFETSHAKGNYLKKIL